MLWTGDSEKRKTAYVREDVCGDVVGCLEDDAKAFERLHSTGCVGAEALTVEVLGEFDAGAFCANGDVLGPKAFFWRFRRERLRKRFAKQCLEPVGRGDWVAIARVFAQAVELGEWLCFRQPIEGLHGPHDLRR